MPILALFLFGIVQFGLAYDKQQSINSASREGARIAALRTTTMRDIADRAVQAYDASASPGDDPTVQVYDNAGVLVGTRSPAGTYTVLGTASGGLAVQDDSRLMPCGRVSPANFVRVVVSTPFVITIPFFGVRPVTIDSEGQFRCE